MKNRFKNGASVKGVRKTELISASLVTLMITSTLLSSLFKFKAHSNFEMLAELEISSLDPTQGDGFSAVRVMNHIYVVDQIFKAHLISKPHAYSMANTTETPDIDNLKLALEHLDHWYVDYVASLSEPKLEEKISFTFTDGTGACMSREEMLMHLITHGSYHRGVVGAILSRNGGTPPKETFTRFLHEKQPERRE
ncbi:MAG: DinB family protein [Pseudomonas sp.]